MFGKKTTQEALSEALDDGLKEVLKTLKPDAKLMYELLLIRGTKEQMFQFAYHMGRTTMIDDMVSHMPKELSEEYEKFKKEVRDNKK